MKRFTPYFKQGLLVLALCWTLPIYALQFDTEKVTCTGPDAGNDGKATVIISGGQAPYSIVWSNGDSEMNFSGSQHTIENLAPNTYSVVVTDADNCISEGEVEVKSEVEVNVTGGGMRTICQGDPVQVTLSANTTCSTCIFQWSTGASSKTITVSGSGTYSCTISSTNGACMDTDQTTVTIKIKDCDEDDPDIEIPIAHAVDPNDILGPNGVGPNKWVSVHEELDYKIRFENDPVFANAPAQIVRVNCPIDSNLNIFSLELNSFGFGAFNFDIPANSTFYQTQVDVSDSLGVLVNFTAGLDVAKNEVFWIFESVDPLTGLPPSALLGFLPVNDTSTTRFNDTIPKRGEGYVTFTLKPKLSAITGDTIFESASIVFDVNAPILTPTIFNRVDADNPASIMTPSMATVDTASVALNWTGSDVGSGTATYLLYVSENSGPFVIHKDSISGLTYTFEGTAGNAYDFFTIARDSVGNLEPLKTSPEESVIINGELEISPLLTYCAGDSIDIAWESGGITQLDLYYSLDSGLTFTVIDTMITAGNRSYKWHYPRGVVGDTEVLIQGVSGALSDTSAPFLVRSLLVDAGLDTVICAGDTLQLGGTPTALSSGLLTYKWNTSFGLNDSIVSNPLTYTNTTTEYILMVSDTFGCTEIDTVTIKVNNTPGIIYSKTNVTCSNDDDGTVNLTLTNGVAPYNITWSDGDTSRTRINVPAGNYTVTVEDLKGCISTKNNINVFDIYFSGIDAGLDQTLCVGDTVEIGGNPTFYGGQGSVTYSWTNIAITDATIANPLVSPTSDQTYIITATDSVGCSRKDTVFIDVVNPPTLNPTVTNITCSGSNDGAISLNIINGTMPYTIVWADGDTSSTRTNLAVGEYDVTVTDANNCTVLDTNLTIIENSSFTVELGAEQFVCAGDSVQLNPIVSGGAVGTIYTYNWEGSPQLSDTTIANPFVQPVDNQFFVLTVNDGTGCSAFDTAFVNLSSTPFITQQITDVGCNGSNGAVELIIQGGATPYSIIWNDGNTNIARTGLTAGTYYVTVTDGNNCNSAADTVIINQLSGVSDTTRLTATTCIPSLVGLSTMTFTAQNGCDSLIITTTTLLPSDTTYIDLTSCNTSDVGVTMNTLQNQYGCDSLIVTNVTFSQSDTILVAATTCDPSLVGITNATFTNQFSCDSLVITTTTLLPSDTTRIDLTTCDPNNVVTQVLTLQNQAGCDSLVITNVVFAESDTTYIDLTSCNTGDIGTTNQLLQNEGGCDSLVITTITFSPSDTTTINLTTTNPIDVGQTIDTLTNQFNCDSLIITNTVLISNNDTTYIDLTNCDPANVGQTTATFTNQNGGDSLVITTTTLLQSDTTYITLTSCNSIDIGTTNQLLQNEGGCDSLVVITITFSPSDTTTINLTTTNPIDVGQTIDTLTNQFNCDSLIITNTVLISNNDTTYIDLTNCDPANVGQTTAIFTNQNGGDSLVITTTTLLQSDTTMLALTTCNPILVGVTNATMTNQFGCDSLIITTTSLLQSDTTYIYGTTCDSNLVGVVNFSIPNPFGCNDLIITTTTLLLSDTTYLTSTTCDSSLVGITNQIFINTDSCDSLVITTTTLLQSDTTYLTGTTCDLSLVGVTNSVLTNENGCDSLVITTTTLLQSDTTYLASTTCDASLVGVSNQNLTNQNSCDSLVITTTILLQSDTTYLTGTTCDPSLVGVLNQNLTNQNGCDSLVITTTTLLQSDTTYLASTTCDASLVGVTNQNLTNQNGCDSLVITTTTLLQSDTTYLASTTCDASLVGVLNQNLTNENGCDSLVITTTTLLQSDTTYLTGTTCDSSLVGITNSVLTNQNGCDSLVITTTTLLQSDTTYLTGTTCDLSLVGVTNSVLTNENGCDSLVITTTTLLQSDTTYLTGTTCDPSLVGVTNSVLTNENGCDSLVITTTTLLQSDTTYLTGTTCDLSLVGVTNSVLTNENGCDSLVITTTTLLQSDTTYLIGTTCDLSLIGVTNSILTNENGCDSLVITTTTLLQSDTTYLTGTTCDLSLIGVTNSVLTNENGCDSLVITTTTLLQSDTTYLTGTTCDPSLTGVTNSVLTNENGCDSLVITTTTLLQSDTTYLTGTTCDPSLVGVLNQNLTNQNGCDSLVITTTTLLQSDTTYLTGTTCDLSLIGVTNSVLTNENGCDSLVITTITLLPNSIDTFQLTTCDPALAGIMTQNLTNQFGCDSIVTTVTTLLPSPNLTVSGDTAICIGASVQLQASGGDSYSWTPTTGLSSSTIANPTATPTVTTTYLVTATNINGCQTTDSVTVTIHNLPNINAGVDTSICIGDTVQLQATGGLFYNWPPLPEFSNPSIANPLVSPTTTTQYIMSGTDANGCQNSDTIIIAVNALPLLGVSADTSICIGETVQLNAFGADSYSWLPSTGLSDSTIANPIASPTSTTTYIVRGNNLTGCNAVGSVTVVVNDLSTIDAGLDTTICIGESVQLNATSSAAISYNWSPSATLDNATIANPTASPTTSTTYTVAITDINGCTNIDSVTVNINALPTITAGFDTTICAAQSVQLQSNGGVSYHWTPNTSIDDPTLTNPTVNPMTTTTYTVAGTDANGCVNTDSVIITVNPLPIVTVTSDTIVCYGDTVQITASGGTTYLWTSGLNISNVNIPNPFFTPTASSIYSVLVTNSLGCQSAGSLQINVTPTPDIQASNDTTICLGQSVQLNATGGLTYSWSPTASLSNSSIADPFATPLISTVYTVLGIGTDGCLSYDSTYVEVYQTTQPTIAVIGDSLMATGVMNPVSYRWFFNGVPIFGGNNALWFALSSGQYIVEVTDSNGCAINSMPYNHIHTGIEVIRLTDLTIQPNPAYDYVDLKFTMPRQARLQVQVRDVVGRLMYQEQHGQFNGVYDKRLDLSRFASGLYVVQILVDGQLHSEKLVVTK